MRRIALAFAGWGVVAAAAAPAMAQDTDDSRNAIFATTRQLVVSNVKDPFPVQGCTTSPACLIKHPGPGGISLREAIMAVNNATGPYTITFNAALAGKTIVLQNRFPPLTHSGVTLTGLKTKTGAPDITIDASHVLNQFSFPILFIAAPNFTMTGMNFTSPPSKAVSIMQIGGFNYGLTGHLVSSPAQMCCVVISGNAFRNGINNFAINVPAMNGNETISKLTFSNNTFSQLGVGIELAAGDPAGRNNNTIEDVVVFGNTFFQSAPPDEPAVELAPCCGRNNLIQRVQIVQNTFLDNGQCVILDHQRQAVQSSIQNVTIARNVFIGNGNALGPSGGNDQGTMNNEIRNVQFIDNLVALTAQNSDAAQIDDNQGGAQNNKVSGLSFVNNTIYNGTKNFGGEAWGVWVISSGGVSGVSISNTIFWGNAGKPPISGIASPSQVTYSIIDQTGFTGVNHNINADPRFVNPSGGNFQLQSGSPALNAGTHSGAPTVDLDCRPFHNPPSIGAYQFQGPSICSTTPPPP